MALPVYWVALFAATHYPSVRIPGQIPQGDKLVHFAAFAILALLYWRFMKARGRRVGALDAAILLAYAALDEWLQQFVGRFTDRLDFLANAAGIVTVFGALAIARVIARRGRPRPG